MTDKHNLLDGLPEGLWQKPWFTGLPVITNPNLPRDQVLIMDGELLRSLGGMPPKDMHWRARIRRAWRELFPKEVPDATTENPR